MGNQHKNESFNAKGAAKDNLIGKKLYEARTENKIKQNAFVRQLENYGVSISRPSYSCWEAGTRTPNAYQLLAMCRALGIDDIAGFFLDGRAKSTRMDQLSEEDRAMVESYISFLMQSGGYEPSPAKHIIDEENDIDNITDIKMYMLAASAGTGQYLDGEEYETIRIPERFVPNHTDFAVRIAGDSMEPAFYSGQIVFVESTVALKQGDIGIFVVDGESYIKKYSEEMPEPEELEDYMFSTGNVQKKPVLISLNKKYTPIHITQNNKFSIVGKVLNRNGFDL